MPLQSAAAEEKCVRWPSARTHGTAGHDRTIDAAVLYRLQRRFLDVFEPFEEIGVEWVHIDDKDVSRSGGHRGIEILQHLPEQFVPERVEQVNHERGLRELVVAGVDVHRLHVEAALPRIRIVLDVVSRDRVELA